MRPSPLLTHGRVTTAEALAELGLRSRESLRPLVKAGLLSAPVPMQPGDSYRTNTYKAQEVYDLAQQRRKRGKARGPVSIVRLERLAGRLSALDRAEAVHAAYEAAGLKTDAWALPLAKVPPGALRRRVMDEMQQRLTVNTTAGRETAPKVGR
jgi:hypothetical protein